MAAAGCVRLRATLPLVPYPFEYSMATKTFQELLDTIVDESELATSNQAFTTLESVLRAFRRRVSVSDSLRFADVLPVAVRALYVHDWDIAETRLSFEPRDQLGQELRSLRPGHNWSSDTAVADVARALRKFVHPRDFEAVLAALPEPAAAFWRV